ncbi:MAG TPA: preprotein translocase subunit SecA [Patescibacteria group bacterium]|nr:preprotein translocase subunit SecA [Patescibacteria group bacterium]
MSLLRKIFGDPNARVVARLQPAVEKISALEPEVQKLSDEGLAAKTGELKQRLKDGATLDELLPEAFALVREAAKRTLGQRHYDVQMMGGMVLHQGGIAEMRTGEGKTLVATAAVYLNALEGKGVHVITVNDYLARRDAAWMGQVYHRLGLSTSCVNHMIAYAYDPHYKVDHGTEEEKAKDAERDETASFRVDMDYLRPIGRKDAYLADITYGTNNEFGFDYLRDNMATRPDMMVQRELNYAVIDEIDSILIDEARTPLIISAPAEESSELYYRFADVVALLEEGKDYNVDEKMRAATYTEEGQNRLSKALGTDPWKGSDITTIYHLEAALRAKALFHLDKEYVVRDGKVVIVDEFTGRLMPGRRYSEGLHQAIEAKEHVKIERESRTLATVTFQNYFRLYKKLSGMTGTAATEAEEFAKIYKLEVTTIPTNKTAQRIDAGDRVYKNRKGKFDAVVQEIKARNEKGQPVLVGTISIDQNEELSHLLELEGVPHQVLNAKNHEREGEIIAQAGRKGGVTIATNMAGRGVDIILGGNPYDAALAAEVRELGGLMVIGTERHESRRIDNQLRGRAGRQGDPGASQFYVSMEDDLMRIFGSDRMKNMMDKLGIPDDMPIESGLVSKSIESAQHKVEGHNFDIRKHLLEYDDVLNKHREGFYRRRREFLSSDAETVKTRVFEMIEREVEQVTLFHTSDDDETQWNIEEIYEVASTIFPVPKESRLTMDRVHEVHQGSDKVAHVHGRTKIIQYLVGIARAQFDRMEKEIGAEMLVNICRGLSMRSMDTLWTEHLDAIDHLRKGIGLRGYGQRDPLVEYKKEAYRMWNELLHAIERQVVYSIYKVQVAAQIAPSLLQQGGITLSAPAKEGDSPSIGAGPSELGELPGADKSPATAIDPGLPKVGRNDPCPCGSGKKYKKCHGA